MKYQTITVSRRDSPVMYRKKVPVSDDGYIYYAKEK